MTARVYRMALVLLGLTLLLCGLCASTALAAAERPAVAATGPSFAIGPATDDANVPTGASHFLFQVAQGGLQTETFRVTNIGDQAGAVKLYPADATSTSIGGIGFASSSAPNADVGAWITLDTSQLTLAPGQSQTVGMTLTVPSGASAGQHEGGIVAENLTTQTSSSSTHFKVTVVHEYIMLVQVDLPGDLFQRIDITSVSAGGTNGYQTLLVGLKNSGTQIVGGKGILVVSQGSMVEQNLSFSFGALLPGSAIKYPLNVENKALAVGDYTAAVTLTYGDNHTAQATLDLQITDQQVTKVFPPGPLTGPASATHLNVLAIALVVLALLVLFAIIFIVHHKRTQAAFESLSRTVRKSGSSHRDRRDDYDDSWGGGYGPRAPA